MNLPKEYEWLYKELGPRILVEALKDYGLKEVAGSKNNAEIMQWAKELKISWYTADSIPWCGLAMGHWALHAGYPFNPNKLLAAAEWINWGNHIWSKIKGGGDAMLGDVLIFSRTGGGHVGLYIGEDKDTFCVYGGNQSDAVGFTWIAKSRLVAVRRSPFKIGQPSNVRKITLKRTGAISTNEQ